MYIPYPPLFYLSAPLFSSVGFRYKNSSPEGVVQDKFICSGSAVPAFFVFLLDLGKH